MKSLRVLLFTKHINDDTEETPQSIKHSLSGAPKEAVMMNKQGQNKRHARNRLRTKKKKKKKKKKKEKKKKKKRRRTPHLASLFGLMVEQESYSEF